VVNKQKENNAGKKKRKCRLGHENEKGRRGGKLGSPWLIMIALQLKSTLACSPDGRSMGTEAAAQSQATRELGKFMTAIKSLPLGK